MLSETNAHTRKPDIRWRESKMSGDMPMPTCLATISVNGNIQVQTYDPYPLSEKRELM